MKILFLDPPHTFWEFFRGMTASPSLIYLVAVARREFDVKVFDASMEPDSPWDRTAQYLEKERPDVVAITGSVTAFWPTTLNCAKLVREILPKARIITGGYTASIFWEDALRDEVADYVIMGEGELTLMELLRALNANKTDVSRILGLAYLKNGAPVKNAARPLMQNLDELPPPAYDLFPMERYGLAPFGGKVGFTVTLARGCQGNCVFCSETQLWQHTWRGHGAQYMVDTLEVLSVKYGKKIFYIGDNDFLHDEERTEEFIALMTKRRPDVKMWIQTTCANLIKNEKHLKYLRDIGVYQIMLGIETVSPEGLKRLNKPQTMETVTRAVSIAHSYDFILMGMLMWGAPWDTKAGLHNTFEFLSKTCDIIGPNATTPWPGTSYYQECEKMGAIEVRDLSKYNMLDCVTRTAELSAKESDAYYKNVVGKGLLFNKKSLYNYFFSNKLLYRTYYMMFVKMGWSFFTGKPWRQKNYQRFEDFIRKRHGDMIQTGVRS
ncbi:MAG: cobalamin B12-binding domain-containing protein [Elusimicrobia bacterium]|nr:cobalamin B12-binding domain-containing protein [Elusimicrobiota bacterium]